MTGSVGDRFWVPHPELVFAPLSLAGTGGGAAKFVDAEGAEFPVPAEKFEELERVHDAQLQGVENVCALEEVSQAALLHTVRTRYGMPQCKIYTRVARIVIAVNPFRSLPIYSAEVMLKYVDSRDSMDLPPHIFAVGQDAIMGLKQANGKNQAVLISGESGAGKTESTKLVLSYIAQAAGSSVSGSGGGIQDKVMQTNPVLESFGNAMTVRNNNSSRFGKWLQMTMSDRVQVQGCSVTDYLLELTRVCRQGEKERNYHVFFQLIAVRDQLKELEVGEPQSYRYLKDAQFKAPGVDDKRCFEELQEAFTSLGFQDTEQTNIFKIVAGILSLGNCDFEDENDASRLADGGHSARAAALLGISAPDLEKSMLVRSLVVGKDVTETGRTAVQAAAARDSLARLLYGRLFKLLVAKINVLLSAQGSAAGSFFGVLDIAGFESFEVNSLEQLFINLSNEHLQNHFNDHVFKMELEDYKAEGIDLAGCMDFQDNSDIIALIDSKGSILAMLDEELTVPRATDATYAAKVTKAHEKHPRFVKPKFAGTTFGIRHFAGEVTYSLEGFLEKNVDKPPDEAPKLFQASTNSIVKDIGDVIAADLAEAASAVGGRGGGKKAAKTVSSNFRQSLASLVQKLGQAEPHFIRCIKPNAEKVPEKFTSKLVMDQLNCSGVFEAVRIRQSGFATRMLFKEFIGRYRHVVPRPVQAQVFGKSAVPDEAQRAKIFVDALPAVLSSLGCDDPAKDIRLGKTKAFVRSRVMHTMDRARDLAMSDYAVTIQAVWRGHQARKMVKECYRVFDQVKAWQAENAFYQNPGSNSTALAKLKTGEAIDEQIAKLNELLREAELLPLAAPNAKQVQSVKDRMRLESQTLRMLEAAGTSIEPVEVDKALLKAKELELPATPKLEELRSRSANLKFQVPIVKAIQNAIESKDPDEMLEVLNSVKKQGLHQHPENWIEELKGEKLAGDLYSTMEKIKEQRKQEEVKQKMHQDLVRNVEQDLEQQKAKLDIIDSSVSEKDGPKRPRANTRKSKARVTITGLTEEAQDQILIALDRACEMFDVEGIEANLALALREGVEAENERLMRAQDCFAALESKDFVLQTLKELQEEMVASSPKEAYPLKSLQNLLKQAEKLGASQADVEDVRSVMQEFVRKRTRQTVKGQIFEDIDVMELDLADNAFSDLSLFGGLKPASEWKGHHARLWLMQGKTGAENMLRHAKHELKSALTKLPPAQEHVACAAFTNILSWMGDKPVPEVQRAGLASVIVDTAVLDKNLADEMYVQLMKQLTDNASSRCVSRGWELMLTLCQNACPSNELHEYLHVFLINSLTSSASEDAPIIRQCIADLNLTAHPDVLKPDDLENVSVTLVDFSTRRVRIPRSATLRQLGDVLAKTLRISEPREFACYMMTEGISHHRLLPDTAIVNSLLPKWKTLKERTGKNTTVLYKRRLLRKEEALPPGDFAHANLTYQQALFDYLHYPMCDNMEPFYKIAGAVMWAHRDHFRRFMDKGYMANKGVLEQVLPEESLASKRRSNEVTQVTEAFKKLEATCDAQESRLIGISRAFVEMQKLPMFGAYIWQGKQVFDIEKEKQPVAKAPRTVCTINPKGTEAEYYICVDYSGLRFLAQGSGTAAQPFHRDFQLNDEAVERLITWGVSAQEGLAQFVVSSVNPVSMEREPMSIVISCQAAVDIAYAVHMIKALKDGESF